LRFWGKRKPPACRSIQGGGRFSVSFSLAKERYNGDDDEGAQDMADRNKPNTQGAEAGARRRDDGAVCANRKF